MQRDGEGEPNERNWLRDETGGSVYLRLSTRALEQPQRQMTPDFGADIVDGAYWLRQPGPNAQVVIAYHRRGRARGHRGGGPDGARTGATSACSPSPPPTGSMPAGRRRSGRASAASSMRAAISSGCSADSRSHCGLVTVIDGHPATLAWLGAVHGPPHPLARRRAFRPDRHGAGPLPPFRHRRARHRRGGGNDRPRQTHTAPEGAGLTLKAAAAITPP